MPKKGKRGVSAPHIQDSTAAGELQTMHRIVLGCLEDIPTTRSSDKRLIVQVLNRMGKDINVPFWQVMEDTELPSFETITRCRRKIQEERTDLRAIEPIESARISRQIEFIDYAGGTR